MSLWNGKRDSDNSHEAGSTPSVTAEPAAPPVQESTPGTVPVAPRQRVSRGESIAMANIGKSISIKGDVVGEEDTVIEGRVEGHIELKNHHLTVGPNGDVRGEISAKQVTIVGKVTGNVSATERVEICDSGRIEGDISSARLLVQEGAELNGNVKMQVSVSQGGTKPQEAQKAG